jgi:hypothetical protein
VEMSLNYGKAIVEFEENLGWGTMERSEII